jgi:hypothetical protein
MARLCQNSRCLLPHCGFGGGVAENERQQECQSCQRRNRRENSTVGISFHFSFLDFLKMGRSSGTIRDG